MIPTLSARTRATIYWVGWFIGVVAGSSQVVVATMEGEVPTTLVIIVGVLLFVQSQINALAGLNVTGPPADEDEPRHW